MPEQEISWREAVLQVLEDADEPLHYRDIAAEILNRGLKRSAGKTPSDTVAGIISRLRSEEKRLDIVKSQPGYFHIRAAIDTSATPEQEEANDDLDATDAQRNLAVAAYGLHWERDKVDWSARRLYGWDDANSNPMGNYDDFAINFANQQGVYLLHSWDAVVYVGRTIAENNGLFQRLHAHHSAPAWSAKWERFSWFGIRRVNSETGELYDGPDNASKQVVSSLMESVLIETLRPAFNRRQGDYMGTLYRQLVDPDIAEREARELMRRLVR